MKKYTWIIILVVLISAAVILFFMFSSESDTPSTTVSMSEPPQVEEIQSDQPQTVASTQGQPQWLELPAMSDYGDCQCVTHYAQMQGRSQRNYTMLYDPAVYASYWVAYPLCSSHMTSGREEQWEYDPKIDESLQTSVVKGYGASRPTLNYPKNFYARGHQLPNADRNAVPQMQAQTYYSTNITPQLQNGFNGGIWAKLEQAVRSALAQSDTLYIVTGASFQKVGESLEVSQIKIKNKNDNKIIPVPNYYWKALLKVKRSGGQIVDASTVGFWLPHEDLKGHSYEEFAVSVDQIEAWTGYDMFTNLSNQLENKVEKSCDWNEFRSY